MPLVISLMLVINIIGSLGNIMVVIVVLSKKKRQSYANLMILNLAVSDLLAVLFCIPLDIPLLLSNRWLYGGVFCKIYTPIGTITLFSSVFTLVTLTFTRYWAITHPFRKQVTATSAKISIAVIWVLGVMLVIPLVCALRYEASVHVCWENWGHMNNGRIYTLVIFVFGFLLPLVIISVAYLLIYLDVVHKQTSVMEYHHLQKVRENKKLIKLSFVVTITFAMCILPNQLVWLFSEFGSLTTVAYYPDITLCSHILIFLNSALNPFIYNVFNSTFRTGFRELIEQVSCCLTSTEQTHEADRELLRVTTRNDKHELSDTSNTIETLIIGSIEMLDLTQL